MGKIGNLYGIFFTASRHEVTKNMFRMSLQNVVVRMVTNDILHVVVYILKSKHL